jgi:hypothetical protein
MAIVSTTTLERVDASKPRRTAYTFCQTNRTDDVERAASGAPPIAVAPARVDVNLLVERGCRCARCIR